MRYFGVVNRNESACMLLGPILERQRVRGLSRRRRLCAPALFLSQCDQEWPVRRLHGVVRGRLCQLPRGEPKRGVHKPLGGCTWRALNLRQRLEWRGREWQRPGGGVRPPAVGGGGGSFERVS